MNKFTGASGEVKLINLEPGHFHAALIQKTALKQVNDTLHVYSSGGVDLDNYLNSVDAYNQRDEEPTQWTEVVYQGDDFFEKMLAEKKGNVVVISGNNMKKTEYIHASLSKGLNVLADKPMAINFNDFQLLEKAFDIAKQKNVLLFDIMTERFEITTILQKEIAMLPRIFGQLADGTADDPAVVKESIHHFFKHVSEKEVIRPGWFFDVTQQGEGIVDVSTHLVDLVQWACFPETTIDYHTDIQMVSSYHWPTLMNPEQFTRVTQLNAYPHSLEPYLVNDSVLGVYANGEINYKIKGKHVKIIVKWDYQAPQGRGDSHFSMLRGTKSNLIIRQGANENFEPILYIEPLQNAYVDVKIALNESFYELQERYPGISLDETSTGWKINIPERYKVGHEAHFSQVTEKYLNYLVEGRLPKWEVPNMLAKYYVTTKALQLATDLYPEKYQ